MGERGTPECRQCALKRKLDSNPGFRDEIYDTDKWEENPCIDLKETINEVLISTVFLHHDHSMGTNSDPVFYETMIFDNTEDGCLGDEIYCNRYTSKAEAIRQHNIIVSFLKTQTYEDFREWLRIIAN